MTDMSRRNFTTTEEADISYHPMTTGGFLWVEENYAETQAGDRLYAIGDNLYRIEWNDDNYVVAAEFNSLARALSALDS